MTFTKTLSETERFLSKTAPEGECLVWTGALNNHGYGLFKRSGPRTVSSAKAHRVAWLLFVGSIPDGLFVCHRCDNRRCVKVEHLFLGTHDHNMMDMWIKGRNRSVIPPSPKLKGSAHGRAILTDDNVREIRAVFRLDGRMANEMAAKFGVSASTVRSIARGRTWKHLLPKSAPAAIDAVRALRGEP